MDIDLTMIQQFGTEVDLQPLGNVRQRDIISWGEDIF